MKQFPIFTATLFASVSLCADSTSSQIPEGKISDYHAVYPDITPPAGPRVIQGWNVTAKADYLYWTAREDNLQYASTGYTNDPATSVAAGRAYSPHFQYKSGFKAGLGYSFEHDCWDTALVYTWFLSNHNTGSTQASYSDGLTPSFSPYITMGLSDYFSSAQTLWGIRFQVIDWELGRNCYVSKYISLRPFLGLKGSWQKQKFNNTYKGTINDSSFVYSFNNHLSYWGVGVRSGINTAFHFSDTWSLYGDIALSALWSSCRTKRDDRYTLNQNSIHPVEERNNINALAPVLELGMGIRKDLWIYNDRVHIGAQFGWEEQVWWDQNQFSSDLGVARGGNLFLQGLTVQLRFDF